MGVLFAVGLPLFALATLIPLYILFSALLPYIEPLFLKAAAFNVFEIL